MGQKTVEFSEEGISQLPNDKPAVYKILTLKVAATARESISVARFAKELWNQQ